MRLLERSVATIDQRLVLLAPSEAAVLPGFRNRATDAGRHREFVLEMQQLRGGIYLRDGAVERRHLAPNGSHRTPEDEQSWHLLMLNSEGRVSACAWYLGHESTVNLEGLRMRTCPLLQMAGVQDLVRRAVTADIAQARREGIGYGEVGGWAASKDGGSASDGLMLVLAGYSLSRQLGDALGTTTATVRHCSSTILRRLGATSLAFEGATVPPYYDPAYRCDMELLRFDSRRVNRKYVSLIEQLRAKLADVLVLTKPATAMTRPPYAHRSFAGLSARVDRWHEKRTLGEAA